MRGANIVMYLYDGENNLETSMNLINEIIEDTRYRLNKLVEERYDNITDYEVIELSQKLDKLLVKYMKLNLKVS